MKPLRLLLFAILALAVTRSVLATPARFWLSTSNSNPVVTSPPTVTGVAGSVRELHIWGQPGSVDTMPPSSTLQNVALNVVSTNSGVEFLFNETVVYNPQLDPTTPRYETTSQGFDIKSQQLFHCELVTAAAGICSIQGLSFGLSGTPTGAGIGPACAAGDPFCSPNGGNPAWLVASFRLKSVAISGSTNLHLQIGDNGMSHVDHESTATQVVFDPVPGCSSGSCPIYNASSNRNVTQPLDAADAVILFVLPGDYNGNSSVGSEDYDVWRNNFGSRTNLAADGNTNDVVDAADYVIWRDTVGSSSHSSSSPAFTALPEPSTAWPGLLCLSAWIVLGFRSYTRNASAPCED